MAKYRSSEDMENDVCEILRDTGSLGFSELMMGIITRRKDRGQLPGSSDTLSNALKVLQEKGIVVRDIRSRKYSLTRIGSSITTQAAPNLDTKLDRSSVSRLQTYLNPAQRNMILFLAKAHIRALEAGGAKRTELPEAVVEQLTNQFKRFAEDKTRAITALWIDIVMNFINDFSAFFPSFMLMQSSLVPGSLRKEDMAGMIQKATDLWERFRFNNLQRTLSNYLSNPEVLAALDRAIKEGRFKDNLVESSYEEVCSKLKAQGYLKGARHTRPIT